MFMQESGVVASYRDVGLNTDTGAYRRQQLQGGEEGPGGERAEQRTITSRRSLQHQPGAWVEACGSLQEAA